MIGREPARRGICEEMLNRLYDYLNRRDLTAEDEEEIRRHLQTCPPCEELFNFEERLIARLRLASPCRCPDTLRARVRALLDLK